MNLQQAEWVAVLLARAFNDPSCLPEATTEFLNRFQGKPGTGACVCQVSPEYAAKHRENNPDTNFTVNMYLDHRCPHHGEKAQPEVWGRHKEKELEVSLAQWQSLGVTHEVTK